MDVVLINKVQNIFSALKKLSQKIADPSKIKNDISNNKKTFYPGVITYINGNLVFWDITKTSENNLLIGAVTDVTINSDNTALITLDNNDNFSQLSTEIFYLFKRKNDSGDYVDIPQPYKIININSDQKQIKLAPVDLVDFTISTSIIPDIQKDDKLYEAGSWQKVLSETITL